MMTAIEPVTVTVSHRLGREEAKRRIDGGLAAIRRDLAHYVRSVEYEWQGDRLDFRMSAMLQKIAGRIDVFEDHVRIELTLPRLLHLIARTVTGQIEQRGQALLGGPPKKG